MATNVFAGELRKAACELGAWRGSTSGSTLIEVLPRPPIQSVSSYQTFARKTLRTKVWPARLDCIRFSLKS